MVCCAAHSSPLRPLDLTNRSVAEIRPPQAAQRVSGANQKAIRKGHRYATILTDMENGCVIDLVEERTKEAVLQLPGQWP